MVCLSVILLRYKISSDDFVIKKGGVISARPCSSSDLPSLEVFHQGLNGQLYGRDIFRDKEADILGGWLD